MRVVLSVNKLKSYYLVVKIFRNPVYVYIWTQELLVRGRVIILPARYSSNPSPGHSAPPPRHCPSPRRISNPWTPDSNAVSVPCADVRVAVLLHTGPVWRSVRVSDELTCPAWNHPVHESKLVTVDNIWTQRVSTFDSWIKLYHTNISWKEKSWIIRLVYIKNNQFLLSRPGRTATRLPLANSWLMNYHSTHRVPASYNDNNEIFSTKIETFWRHSPGMVHTWILACAGSSKQTPCQTLCRASS